MFCFGFLGLGLGYLFLLPLPNRVFTFILKEGLRTHILLLELAGVLGIENPLESWSKGDIANGAIPLLGVWKEDGGGADGGGIGLIKLEAELELLAERTGLIKLVHEANRRFCKSLEGVELAIRWLGLVEDRGDIMEETARFKRLLVGVLLKLNARFTWKEHNKLN